MFSLLFSISRLLLSLLTWPNVIPKTGSYRSIHLNFNERLVLTVSYRRWLLLSNVYVIKHIFWFKMITLNGLHCTREKRWRICFDFYTCNFAYSLTYLFQPHLILVTSLMEALVLTASKYRAYYHYFYAWLI